MQSFASLVARYSTRIGSRVHWASVGPSVLLALQVGASFVRARGGLASRGSRGAVQRLSISVQPAAAPDRPRLVVREVSRAAAWSVLRALLGQLSQRAAVGVT